MCIAVYMPVRVPVYDSGIPTALNPWFNPTRLRNTLRTYGAPYAIHILSSVMAAYVVHKAKDSQIVADNGENADQQTKPSLCDLRCALVGVTLVLVKKQLGGEELSHIP